MKIYMENLTHLLFPPRCPFCDKVLFSSVFLEQQWVCPACVRKPEYVQEPVCKKCGKPLEDQRKEYCYDCKKQKHIFRQGKALWVYQKETRSSIYRFKYQGRQEYAHYYGRELAQKYGAWIEKCQIDGLVPIPLSRKRQWQRGFNQAALIAKEVSRQTGIPVYEDLLVRVRDTRAQKELNDEERKNNLKKAFKTKANKVQLDHILLIDDIYTTGSTMNEAADQLRKSGTDEVYCLSLSIGRGYQDE